MSKITKLVIAAVAVVLVGVILLLVGLSHFNFSMKNLVDTLNENGVVAADMEHKTYTAAGEINSIVVDDSNVKVVLLPTESDVLTAEYYENDRYYYEISESNGVLNIKKIVKPIGISLGSFTNINLTIWVPSSVLAANIETSNASINLTNIVFSEFEAKSSNGSVNMESCHIAGNAVIKTSNASVNFESVNVTGSTSVKTSNGSINLHSSNFAKLGAETNNARIEAFAVTGSEIELISSNGRISVDDIAPTVSLRLKTSNARIEGTIAGSITDYTLTSDTNNGHNSLPSSYGNGSVRLEINTSNGAIDVEFEED